MTSRERVIAAVEFREPDKIPFAHSYLPSAFAEFPGLPELLERYPSDFRGDVNNVLLRAGQSGEDDASCQSLKKGNYYDEWNCLWTVAIDGILGQVTGHPLADDESIRTYKWPSFSDLDLSADKAVVASAEDKYTRVGWITYYERMIDLRGFEELLCDIIMDTEIFREMGDRILEYNLGWIDRLLDLDPDCIAFADDWGSQTNLMLSPELWEKHFLPVYKIMFKKVHDKGKHVFFHTDGYTMPILQQLVDAGVDLFWADMTVNPVEELAEKLSGKVCFQGLTDVQFLTVDGTPDEVRDYCRKLMYLFGRHNGGFIGCHEVAPDQPWDNVVAIHEVFNTDNVYPLKID